MKFEGDETVKELLDKLGVKRCDFLIIGDGSGSRWGYGCGWGCVSIDMKTLDHKVWCGAMNNGTVNIAEMMAYLQPLQWYVSREAENRKDPSFPVDVRYVHIITDSQYVKNRGSNNHKSTGPNAVLWQVFKQFGTYGMKLHWHWVPRETLQLNRLSDMASKQARIGLKGVEPTPATIDANFPGATSIYDLNKASDS